MPFIGHWYILVLVLAIVLIVYGPGKLPEVGGAIGRAMREFRKASSDLQDEIKKGTAPETPSDNRPAPDRPVTDVTSKTDTKAS
jgi:sec-independent protein translocase protein TatA